MVAEALQHRQNDADSVLSEFKDNLHVSLTFQFSN